MLTTVYLVRHAQALPLSHQREPEWALSPTGSQQAQALVPILTGLGIQRVYTSPFRRTRETIAPFCEATGILAVAHEGLRERCLSQEWIGDFRDVWRRSWADLSFALAGGESSLECRGRVLAAVEEIVRRHAGETIAVTAHGYTTALFLSTIDPTFGEAQASALRTPEIVKIVHDGTRFDWHQAFTAGAAFDAIATHFRQTPGIVA